MATRPNPEQLKSLQLFAAANGRAWRTKLNDLWVNGAYNNAVLGDADSAHLQQCRNQFGPSWLARFRFGKDDSILSVSKLQKETERDIRKIITAIQKPIINIGYRFGDIDQSMVNAADELTHIVDSWAQQLREDMEVIVKTSPETWVL